MDREVGGGVRQGGDGGGERDSVMRPAENHHLGSPVNEKGQSRPPHSHHLYVYVIQEIMVSPPGIRSVTTKIH